MRLLVEIVDVHWLHCAPPGLENGSPAPRTTVAHRAGGCWSLRQRLPQVLPVACRMQTKSLPESSVNSEPWHWTHCFRQGV